jgi:hypothetical protein
LHGAGVAELAKGFGGGAAHPAIIHVHRVDEGVKRCVPLEGGYGAQAYMLIFVLQRPNQRVNRFLIG